MFSIIAQNFIDFSASLVRETHLPIPIYVTNHGITPARAGTTHLPFSQNLLWQDHPRSRGNHTVNLREYFGNVGSPPLTREPLLLASSSASPMGITPAHAGTTFLGDYAWKKAGDHPRSRGNHTPRRVPANSIPGSPPLTREPLILSYRRACVQGITPAHAGTTHAVTVGHNSDGDHPRSRGNHLCIQFLSVLPSGSPPLARELLLRRFVKGVADGITPAHAGTTDLLSGQLSGAGDHPRSRGNHPKL